MISERARGVRAILELYPSVHIGASEQSGGRQLLKELETRCRVLNRLDQTR